MSFHRYTSMALAICALAACSKSPIDKFRDEFVAGCESTGGRGSACKCLFKEYEKVYSEKELLMIGNMQRLPADFPEQTAKAGMKCRNE